MTLVDVAMQYFSCFLLQCEQESGEYAVCMLFSVASKPLIGQWADLCDVCVCVCV